MQKFILTLLAISSISVSAFAQENGSHIVRPGDKFTATSRSFKVDRASCLANRGSSDEWQGWQETDSLITSGIRCHVKLLIPTTSDILLNEGRKDYVISRNTRDGGDDSISRSVHLSTSLDGYEIYYMEETFFWGHILTKQDQIFQKLDDAAQAAGFWGGVESPAATVLVKISD